MTAFQRNLDIRDAGDNTNKYSPKWSYNMLNEGTDGGTYFGENYELLESHGAATWAEFPYDTNFKAWCLSAAAWRSALGVRTDPVQYLRDVSEPAGLDAPQGAPDQRLHHGLRDLHLVLADQGDPGRPVDLGGQ
ncbi:MAG: hypothetical protein M0C28_03270 [Candidatus Moduliflexus flocculans]|nr:hypothetical protein [Candidatus Moduliflexus flocculans]